jgi:Beta-galactosidase
MHNQKKLTLLILAMIFVLGANIVCAGTLSSNIVRNSSFELDKMFNGTPMRNGRGELLQHYPRQKTWQELPVEAWWIKGSAADGVSISTTTAKSGKRSLMLNAESKEILLFSAYDRRIEAGKITISAWIKTEGAKGSLSLFAAKGRGNKRPVIAQNSIEIPGQAKDWKRISCTVKFPKKLQALAVLKVTKGKVWIDDVQIEHGSVPGKFNVCREELIKLGFADYDNHTLPKYICGKRDKVKLKITNSSRIPMQGQAKVHFSTWNNKEKKLIAQIKLNGLKEKVIEVPLAGLQANSYIIYVRTYDKGIIVLDGKKYFYPTRTTGGLVSNGMMSSRSVIRFAVVPDIKASEIFGIGNDMIFQRDYFGGYSMKDALAGRSDGISCSAVRRYNDDVMYVAAAAGAPILVSIIRSDRCLPTQRKFANPADEKFLDIYRPEAAKIMQDRAIFAGKTLGKSPSVAAYFINGECAYFSKGKICPTKYADADFRDWCRRRYGTLVKLNRKWKTNYKSWKEVKQFFTPGKFEKNSQVSTKEEIDWKSNIRFFPKETIKKMLANGGKSMDWLRWRTNTSLVLYERFRKTARKYDNKTLYGESLAWPVFWPQVFMPLIREMDVVMLDFQYTSGFRNALGNPMEMIEIMEMSESTVPDKPIWGVEVYVQPSFPPAYVDMQNWGLIAHGITNNLIFAWKPYSDKGKVKKPKAWLEKGAHPMWYMIEVDGSELPQYKVYKKSIKKINAFNKKYDMLATKRIKTDTAIYASHDTNEYFLLSTGNKPYNATWMRARNTLGYIFRMNGFTLDFVDDVTLPDAPGKYRKLIIPVSYVLSSQAAEKIASFAKKGGTVIMVGPSGVKNPWLDDYIKLGGPPWRELGLEICKPNGGKNPTLIDLKHPVPVTFTRKGFANKDDRFRGRISYKINSAKPIKDLDGQVVGWKRKWGKGKLICYSVYPECYKRYPQMSANFNAWLKQLVTEANISQGAHFVIKDKNFNERGLGKGAPVVEVVVRNKKSNEKFVFCMNQGGKGNGVLQVPLTYDDVMVEDALTGEKIKSYKKGKGFLSIQLHFVPWQYNVFRLYRNSTN